MKERDRSMRSRVGTAEVGGPSGSSARRQVVLLVDDDVDHRSLLNVALTEEGYDVAEADDGSSAIAYLLDAPSPSIVLLDLDMPHVSGWQVLSVLRPYLRLRRIPVIVVTGEHAALQVPGVPVVGRMQKPVRLVELIALIGRHASPAGRRAEG